MSRSMGTQKLTGLSHTMYAKPLKICPLLGAVLYVKVLYISLFGTIVSSRSATMPGEATETVPVTEQEMQQPQVETGSYKLDAYHACDVYNMVVIWDPGTLYYSSTLYVRVAYTSSTLAKPCSRLMVAVSRPGPLTGDQLGL